MFHGLSNDVLYAAYRLKTEFYRERDNLSKEVTGTCFFVMNKDQQICLVTNRHMLDVGYSDKENKYISCVLKVMQVEGFLVTGDPQLLPHNRITMRIYADQNQIRFSPTYDEDVACIVNPQVLTPGGSTARIDFYLDYDFLATQDWLDSKLSVCDFVVFPGYPDWHDKLDNRPIMRTGTVASDPRSDYSRGGKPEGRKVAYEAFSFGGSSGSPVLATQKGIKPGAGIQFDGYREPKFIGINAGHLDADYGQHSGISYFFKSSAILALIDSNG